MNKKKIVFLPTYEYLSKNLFLSIVEDLKKDYYCILINHDEYSKINRDDIYKNAFDEYYEVVVNNEFQFNSNFIYKIKKIFIKNFKLRKEILKLIKNIKPNIIITNSDMSLSYKAIKKYCDKRDIKTVILQPSFFDFEKVTTFSIKDFIRKIVNIFVDYFPSQELWGNEYKTNILFLWGNYFSKFYKYQNIKIVGNALYDKEYKAKFNLRQKLKIYDKYVITICSEAFGGLISKQAEEQLFKFYENIINYNPNYFIILKLHPRDSLEYFQKSLCLRYDNYVIISNEYSLSDILHITDLQVSVASVTSLEAIIFNTPVILINPNNQIKINNFFSAIVEERATNIDEFQKKVETIRNDYEWKKRFAINRQKFLDLYCSSIGIASKNIKKEIDRLLSDD